MKSKREKKRTNVEIPTPSNPLKRVKTNAGTPFSPFHPDTKKVSKITSQRLLWGASLARKMEKVPCGRVSKKTSKKKATGNIPKYQKSAPNGDIQVVAFGVPFWLLFCRDASIPGNYDMFDQKRAFFHRKRFRSGQPLRAKLYTWAPQVPTNWRGGTRACLLNII